MSSRNSQLPNRVLSILSILLVLSFVLSACGAPAPAPATVAPAAPTAAPVEPTKAPEPTAAQAVTRDLRRLDPRIELGWVQQTTLLYDEPVVLAARNAVLRQRPDDVKAAFSRELARRARPSATDAESVAPRPRALRSFAPDEYGG